MSDTVASFIARLDSEHALDRDEALDWLIEHPDQSRPALAAYVSAARLDQRTLGAIYVLGQTSHPADVALLERSLTCGEPDLAWESAQALGHHRSPTALAALVTALDDDSSDVVGAAVVALGLRGDETARKPIEWRLDHASESVRYRAVQALGRLGASPSTSALRAWRARETSAEVRRMIDDILGGASDP